VVVDDITAPVPAIAELPVLTGGCSVTATAPTANDNCAGIITGTTTDPLTYTTQGTYTITWTYNDGNGNTSSQTQTVTVDDITAPVPSLATLPVLTGECSVTATAPTANDNCAGIITATTTDPLTYTMAGTFYITWTYNDGNGNTSSQIQTVVVSHNIAPFPTVAVLPTVTGECSVIISAIPTATDNCTGSIINGTTSDPLVYNTQGTYTITWIFDDGNGGSITQLQTVVVDDITAPVPNIVQLPPLTGECSITAIAPAANDNCVGTVMATTTDPLTYNSHGTYTITWTYDDGNGNSSSQTQTVTVIAAPVAADDYSSTQLNTPVNINMLINDVDCDNNINPQTVTVVAPPQHGTVTIDPITGLAMYSPDLNFSGLDNYDYQVCDFDGSCTRAKVHITIENETLNNPPVAVNDSVFTLINTQSIIIVLANDSDPDGNQLTVSICGQPTHGSIILNDNQTFTYFPATGYTGTDEFCYTICDNGTPSLCSNAKVFITIVPDESRPEVTIYNTFTPNGDNKNDTWWIDGIEAFRDNEVQIFNRWGDEVWSAENYDNQATVWNGSNKNGEKLPDATYFYIVKLKSINKVYSGWVMIHK